MPIYNMSVKFSVVHEKQLSDVEAESTYDALTEAWEQEESIIKELVNEYGDNVVLEEIIANPAGEPDKKTTLL